MLLLALALAGLAPADTTLPPAQAPAGLVTVHPQPALPIVALRLSLLADDPPGHAGAGHLIQHLHLPALRERVRRVGGDVQAVRSSDALVYTVTGPAAEVEYLAGVLHSALRPPAPGEAAFLAASRELEDERNAEWETAAAHVRAVLRGQLFPDDLSPAGTPSSTARLTRESIPDLWAEMYRPERVAVVAVGDVELRSVREAFARLPEPPAGGLWNTFPDTLPAAPPAQPEATRGWLGIGWSATDADPAALTVAARLLGATIRERLPTARVEAEHWWTRHGQALVAVVAFPAADSAAARRVVRSAQGALLEELTPAAVRDAAAGARREMLFYARTPERMAQVLGQFVDREGDAEAAQRFYGSLDRVGEAEVRRVLEGLVERTPAFADVPSQKLPTPTR